MLLCKNDIFMRLCKCYEWLNTRDVCLYLYSDVRTVCETENGCRYRSSRPRWTSYIRPSLSRSTICAASPCMTRCLVPAGSSLKHQHTCSCEIRERYCPLVLRSRPYAMQMAVDLTTEPILSLLCIFVPALPSHKILFPEVSKKISRVAESFKQWRGLAVYCTLGKCLVSATCQLLRAIKFKSRGYVTYVFYFLKDTFVR